MPNNLFYVYIITNFNKTVLYTGVTNDLKCRLQEHKNQGGHRKSFTGRYYVHYLIYYEEHLYILNAIAREKQIKGWNRGKKLDLIKETNPDLQFIIL